MELLFVASLLIFVLTVLVKGLMIVLSSNASFKFNQNEFSQAGVVISFLDGTIKIDGKKYDVNDVKTIDSWSSFGCSSPRSITSYYAYIETKNLNNDSKHKKVFTRIDNVKKFIRRFLNNAPYKKHKKVFTSIDNVEKFIKRFNFSLKKVQEYPQGQTYDYISKGNYTFSNCYETVEKTDKTFGLDEAGEIEKNYEPSQAEIDLFLSNVNSNSNFQSEFIRFLKFLGYSTSNVLCNVKIGKNNLDYLVSVPNSDRKLAIIIQGIDNDAVQIKKRLEFCQQEMGYVVYLLMPSKEIQSKYLFALYHLDSNGNFQELDIESSKNIKTISLPSEDIEKNRYRPSQAEIDEIEEKDENYSVLNQFLLFIGILFFLTAFGFMLFRDIHFVLTLSLTGTIILFFLLKS